MAITFDRTIGAVLIGFSVAAVLYGVLLVQIYAYFQRYVLDRPLYKILVVVVLVLETLHSAFSGHIVYHYSISSFGNPLALLYPTWTVVTQILVGALISVLVKIAFTMRVWRFSSNNIVLTGLILLLSAAVLGFSVTVSVKGYQVESFAEAPKLRWATNCALATSVSTDIIIAVSLTYYLHHLRNAFSANTLVNGLIAYSLETGVITSICGITTLVTFDILPTSFVYLAFYFVLSKLYSNSLLATLNTRRVVRGRGTDHTPGTHGEFTIVHSAGQAATRQSTFGNLDWTKRPTDIEVNVLQEVVSTASEPDQYRDKPLRDDGARAKPSYNSVVPQQHVYGRPMGYTNDTVTDQDGLQPPERVARF